MVRPRSTTDEAILEEARACFLEHGAGVSTTVIAARLGISHGVLFQRFGTKEQLMRAALLPPPEPPWLPQVRSGPDDRDARTQLLELAEEISAYLERIVPCVAVLRSAGMPIETSTQPREDLPPVRARREIAAWFARAVARGLLRPATPEHAADLFLGSLHFRPFHQHISGKGFGQADGRAYLEFAVDVLCRTLDPAGDPR
ncbi:TetR family transcriptional regulator [Sorangium cellulosum]|uniref:TetR family transcriptional regulator n=1 Tax=Sorangium cellulosum TaxID=56 RepID=A0A2L0FA30_SORCE|nr:TetR/AcrR family transcriptional regulator [Sorangium cellulosum]AUX48430.1 TetR family transcriptional regulator [Sorangium cellulosum]